MSLFDGILVLLSILGLTTIFVHGIIMDKIGLRPLWEKSEFLKELFHCSMCCSVWLSGWGILAVFVRHHYDSIWFYIMTLPFASSAFCYMLDRGTTLIDESIYKLQKKKIVDKRIRRL